MKCTNCGHELEPGSGFCENCGTIMSLDDVFNEVTDLDSMDIFSGNELIDHEPEFDDFETAKELDVDETEQVVESEIVSDEDAIVGASYIDDEHDELSYDDVTYEPLQENDEDHEHHEQDEESDGLLHEDISSDSDDPFDAAQDDYEEDSSENKSEDDSDDLDDMYIRTKRSQKGGAAIAVMVVFLIVIVAVGASVIKNNFPFKPSTSVNANTSEDASQSSGPTEKETPTTNKTTEETSVDESDEATTENETKESETTTEKTTDETTKDNIVLTTDNETTTNSTVSSTSEKTNPTKPAETKPSTTRHVQTTAPTTVRSTSGTTTTKIPSTSSKPTTTKAQTTANSGTTADPYGFNFVPVEKPSTYLSSTYKVYVTTSALSLRSKPSATSDRIVYLPLGTSCTVYGAQQNGFVYVRSDRYGVYGWVSENYISKSRPESETQVTVPNIVEPDKKYENVQIKHVNDSEGLRLRKGPGTSYDIILRIDNGFPVKVIGYSTTVSGWVYVLDTTHGVYGWVSSAYIK